MDIGFGGGLPAAAIKVPGYLPRVVDAELDELLTGLPALWLDGPKGVGKTATALRRSATVWRLDVELERVLVAADVDAAVAGPTPVLLDEWQRVAPVWDAVKRAVDADPSPGRFLLTGSAVGGTHSGAGRITAVRMRPLTLIERGVSTPTVSVRALLTGGRPALRGATPLALGDYVQQILASGLPGLRHASGRALRSALEGYLNRIMDADLEEAGLRVRRPAALRAWLRAYAAATATTASWETIRDAASGGAAPPARSTVLPFVDVLTRLRVLDPLDAWRPGNNWLARLAGRQKHHLADPGLAAALVGVSGEQLLRGGAGGVQFPRDGPFLGALFESLCVMSVRVFAQAAEARAAHLRTADGRHEVDLIVERADGAVVAVEVKLGTTPDERDVRHLHWLQERIGDQLLDAVVLTTGSRAYRRADGIAVVPLALLGP